MNTGCGKIVYGTVIAAIALAVFAYILVIQGYVPGTEKPDVVVTPTVQSMEVIATTANIRSCPDTACAIVDRLEVGDRIEVLETVTGQEVDGSVEWHRFIYQGQEAYIHASVVSPVRP